MSINLGNPVNPGNPINRGLVVAHDLNTRINYAYNNYYATKTAGVVNGALLNGVVRSYSFPSGGGDYLGGNTSLNTTGFTVSSFFNCRSFMATAGDPDYTVNSILTTGTIENIHLHVMGSVGAWGAGNRLRAFFLRSGAAKGVINTGVSLSLDTWYHGCYTYDGTTARLYQDGVEKGNTVDAGTFDSSTIYRVGSNAYSGGSQEFDGYIAKPRVYNRCLTATEVAALYHQGRINLDLDRKQKTYFFGPAAAAGSTVPVFLHHYRMQGAA